MAKHTKIAVLGSDMLGMIERHTDSNWREVIGWQSTQLDTLEVEMRDMEPGDELCALEAEALRLESEDYSMIAQRWFVVDWPEHVTTPRYNGDAIYHGPMTEAEARAYEPGIEVYGE